MRPMQKLRACTPSRRNLYQSDALTPFNHRKSRLFDSEVATTPILSDCSPSSKCRLFILKVFEKRL